MAKETRVTEQAETPTTAKKRRVTKANTTAEPQSQPQAKTTEVDLYNEVVAFEEKEAKERNAEEDALLYIKICREIKALLLEIASLKQKGNETSLIKEKQIEASLKILMLKKLNRLEKVRMKESRQALQTAREQVDSDHLHLQNMLYEVLHLSKEVKKCLEFKSKDEEMDLIPVEEFYATAPESITNPQVTKKNAHELKLAQLQWELIQRKELAAECKKLEVSKEAVGKEIEAKKEQLNNLGPSLKAIFDATKPLQENLGVSIEKSRKLIDMVYHLPKALYVLYVQSDAYSQVVKWVNVSISGECETTAEESHLDDISSDDSDSDDADLSRRRKINFQDRRKPGGADRAEQKKNECMKKHPLSVVVKITLKTGESLSLEFQWLLLLEIVCVLPSMSINESFGIAADDLLSSRNILSSLFPGDTGETCPNPSTHYQLRRAGMDSFPSPSTTLGIPYRWAQEICGCDLLPSSPDIKVSLCQKTLESTLKIIKTRFRNRLSLARQIFQLEMGYSITHKKILTTLTSFVSITLQDFARVPSAQQILQENIVDGSFIFYKTTMHLSSAKFYAYVAISPNYPKRHPLIILEFSYKGTLNALTSNGLRDIEREVNVYPNDPLDEDTDASEGILLRQIKKLFYCIEIFAHLEFPNDINLQPTYFRSLQGRSRSHPYKYISSAGGIYIHR